jgi:transposase
MQAAETITIPKEEYLGLQGEKNDLQDKVVQLKHQLDQLLRLLYGRKSEGFVPAAPSDSKQLLLDFGGEAPSEQLEQTLGQLVEAYGRKDPEAAKATEHKGRLPLPAHLPRKVEVIEPLEDTSDMVCIGEDVTEILEFTASKLWVRRIVRPRYARKAGTEGQGQVVQAPAKEMPLGRCKAGVSLVAHILLSKYAEHLPLHRLIGRFARSGIKIPASTIGHWAKTGIDLLTVLYQFYERQVFRSDYLQMDETTIKVLEEGKGKCHLGYFWAVFDPVAKLPFFYYHPGRDQKAPKKLLERFAGTLQCDGYGVYETLKNQGMPIRLMNCMAHIRREFFEAKNNDEKRASEALNLIKLLYAIERSAREQQLDAGQRLELRSKDSKVVFDALKNWLDLNCKQVTPKSPIGQAIAYALNRWDNMGPMFSDGNIEIDNNLIENTIRPIAIGRKNYLFAGSHESAQRSAMIYTFFSACKNHGIDPEVWLIDVLNRINDTKITELETLLPHNWAKKTEI